jgi:hypothetical protein
MKFEDVENLLNDFIGYYNGVYLKDECHNNCYSINGFSYETAVRIKDDMKKSKLFKNLSVKKNGFGFGIIYFNVKE